MKVRSLIAVCKTCGLPCRVVVDDDGDPVEVFAVCAHVKEHPEEIE